MGVKKFLIFTTFKLELVQICDKNILKWFSVVFYILNFFFEQIFNIFLHKRWCLLHPNGPSRTAPFIGQFDRRHLRGARRFKGLQTGMSVCLTSSRYVNPCQDGLVSCAQRGPPPPSPPPPPGPSTRPVPLIQTNKVQSLQSSSTNPGFEVQTGSCFAPN